MGRIFTTAPSEWEVDHVGAIVAAQAYQAAHDGALPATPIWRMLERRHDMAPARFARWHPNISLMIAGRTLHAPTTHGWTGRMRGPTLAGLTADPPPAVASVPEPSSLALLEWGIAAVIVVAYARSAWRSMR